MESDGDDAYGWSWSDEDMQVAVANNAWDTDAADDMYLWVDGGAMHDASSTSRVGIVPVYTLFSYLVD